MAVLLEELRSQMKVVIEAVQDCATKTELRSQMKVVTDALRECVTKAELRSQMTVLIEAVQECATKAELRSLTEVVQECATKAELGAFKSEFSTFRADVRGEFEAMNARFDVLTAEVARKAEGAALDALERRVTALEHRAGL